MEPHPPILNRQKQKQTTTVLAYQVTEEGLVEVSSYSFDKQWSTIRGLLDYPLESDCWLRIIDWETLFKYETAEKVYCELLKTSVIRIQTMGVGHTEEYSIQMHINHAISS